MHVEAIKLTTILECNSWQHANALKQLHFNTKFKKKQKKHFNVPHTLKSSYNRK